MAHQTNTAGGRATRAIALLMLVFLVGLAVLLGSAPLRASSGSRAEFMLDPVTGAVLHESNADARLHPASLTKMMTIYIAFEAARNGEFGFDAEATVSAKAAAETGSRLGLREGQRIRLRELVTATAVLSANDAATALAEAIGGSEAAFVARMNDTAQRLGMSGTTFRNAHGLTAEGHLSTARDMSRLGLALLRDHPQFFGLFRQVRAEAGGREIGHTNRLYLQSVAGADGIKTGYTRAAGFNLTASARRGDRRLIVTVMGARGSAERASRVANLMEAGFEKAAGMPEELVASNSRPDELLAGATALDVPRARARNRDLSYRPILAALQGGPQAGTEEDAQPRYGTGSIFATLGVGRQTRAAQSQQWDDDMGEEAGEDTGAEMGEDMSNDLSDGQGDAGGRSEPGGSSVPVVRPRAREVVAVAPSTSVRAPVPDDDSAIAAMVSPGISGRGSGGLGSVGLGLFGQ